MKKKESVSACRTAGSGPPPGQFKKRYHRAIICVLLLLFVAVNISAQQEGGKLSILVTPGMTIPLGDSADKYSFGFSAEAAALYSMPFAPWLAARGGIDYALSPMPAITRDLSTLTFSGGLGVNVAPLPWLGFYAFGMGGYYLSMYNGEAGGSVFAGGEGGIEFYLSPSFTIGAGASYRHLFTGFDPFYQGLKVHLGAVVRFGVEDAKPNIEIFEIRIDPLFPVFYKHYDDHEIGSVGIKNTEMGVIENVRVSFFVPQYMDKPKQCGVIDKMQKDEEATVQLYALFTDNVLSITEGTKINAQIIVEYDYGEKELSIESSDTLRMYDRNAMTWDDDRKAAAFITAKDPEVLRFSKNVAGLVRDYPGRAINLNFSIAMGLFEGMNLHGVNYVIDPKTPYTDLSSNAKAVDYLQFPVQTLEYRAGDCDDLSILYSTLLESTGIEAAFITIPGHIYTAFNLGMRPDDAKRTFQNPGDLIFIDEETWLPVEITMVQQGFLKAWETGAREWRENNMDGNARLYPIHSAWEEFEPVGLAGASAAIDYPESNLVVADFAKTMTRFVEREIADKVLRLEERIRTASDKARQQNRLGVLYARYGLLEKAEGQFRLSAGNKYGPAMINLGNILFMQEDYDEALDYYESAVEQNSRSGAAIVGVARTNYELENHGTVKRTYEKLQRIDPDLADQFRYLVSGSEDTARASAAMAHETVVWDEEE